MASSAREADDANDGRSSAQRLGGDGASDERAARGEGGRDDRVHALAARVARVARATPSGAGEGVGRDRGRTRASAETLLEEYRAATSAEESRRAREERDALVEAVRENMERPEPWLTFLESEEALYVGAEPTTELGKPSAATGSRNGVSLHRLYELATKTIPRRGNVNDENYVRIWLGLARQQMLSNMDDARDTFKFLKSCGIGHKHAIYWCEWAAFGFTFKGREKAVKILKRGLDSRAEPRGAIECFLADIEGQRYEPVQHTQHTPFRSLAPQYTSAIKPVKPRHANEMEDDARAAPKAPVVATPGNLSKRAAALANFQATPTAKFTAPTHQAPTHQAAGTAYVTSSTTMPGSVSSYHSARTNGFRGAGEKTENSMPPPSSSGMDATVTLRSRLAEAKEKYSAMSASRALVAERTPSAAEHTPMDPPRGAPSRPRATEHTPATGGERRVESGAMASADKHPNRPREDDNTVFVNGVKYTKLECVGQGGTCKVFKVVSPKRKILALKRIRLDGKENETVAGFIDEIKLLKTLRGRDNIIQLIDAEVCPREKLIFMVLEFGEIDLAHMLAKREKQRENNGGGGIDDNFLRLYFEQMVEAVNTIHEERIVHSDLKPANFLFVEGALKLIDFGIARAIQTEQAPDHTNIVRDHQVGTVNYMSPEAILNGQASALGGPMKVGRSSDIWSLGCILYQMVYGHTPFSKITGMIQKLHAITDPRHAISFPPLPVDNPALIDLMRRCLERDPRKRISVKEILSHKFLRPVADLASPASADAGLSMTQLADLLAQIQKYGANVDVGAVTTEVFRQISAGEPVALSPIVRRHSRLARYGDENVAPS